ncbi:hypothetical protein K0B04_00490 [Patescibacteria group bacterium]|nr:hypothetical protein [Patescibacteria group bacterium]
MTKFKTEEAIVGSVFSFLYFLFSIQRTNSISKSLIKIRIRYSGRSATKGFLLIISVITALSVFLMSENISSINVGEWAADIVEKPVKEAVEKEYEKQVAEEITSLNLESLKESNPQVAAVLNSFGITELPANISLPESTTESVTGTIKNSISTQINNVVEPYKNLFSPTLALLVFGILQIYNSVIYFIYTNTIFLILVLLKKFGLIHVKTIPVEKEILEL